MSKRSVCSKIKIARLKFMVSLHCIIWDFLLNNFSHVINLLLTTLAWDRTGRISVLGLFCTDRAQRGAYCQDLGPIFSQYGLRAWLIRYILSHGTENYLENHKARLHRRFCRGNSMQFLSQQSCINFQTCSKPLRYRGDKSH